MSPVNIFFFEQMTSLVHWFNFSSSSASVIFQGLVFCLVFGLVFGLVFALVFPHFSPPIGRIHIHAQHVTVNFATRPKFMNMLNKGETRKLQKQRFILLKVLLSGFRSRLKAVNL